MKDFQRIPRERSSKEVTGTPVMKQQLWRSSSNSGKDTATPAKQEELQRQLENVREGRGMSGETEELQQSLESSGNDKETPGMKNSKGEHCKGIAKKGGCQG